jgi:hypothetical protein
MVGPVASAAGQFFLGDPSCLTGFPERYPERLSDSTSLARHPASVVFGGLAVHAL